MSDYERQIEEALARKARESEKNRKSVQTEAGLMNSLSQAFSQKSSGANPEADKINTKSLEATLAERSQKQISSRQDGRRSLSEEKVILPPKETDVSDHSPAARNEAAAASKAEEPDLFAERIIQATEAQLEPVIPVPNPIQDSAVTEKPLRYRRKESGSSGSVRSRGSIVLAILLAVFLAAAGISGGLFYALFTYRPMADAVTGSSCAEVLEGEYIAELNSLAEKESLGLSFGREVLVSGQAVRDIKASLKAAYSGSPYQPETERIGGKIRTYAEKAGIDNADQFSARAEEVYSNIVAAAPDSSWVGQTPTLRLILLAILIGGSIGSIILLVILARIGRAGKLARISFAAAALLLEVISVIVMATGIFRRYTAAYSYITVLSNKYLMGGIAACIVVGAFYMVLAIEAAVSSAKI